MAADAEKPILLVQPRKQDLRERVIEGFGEPKEIVKVTKQFRQALIERIGAAVNSLAESFDRYQDIPAVITLRLHPDALAKTHRPMVLLERVGMRPIGARRFGELLLPATANSLRHLATIAEQNNSKIIRANLSTIEDIVPYGPEDALGIAGLSANESAAARRALAAWIETGKPLLIERFGSPDGQAEAAIAQRLVLLFNELHIRPGQIAPADPKAQFIQAPSLDSALALAAFPGLRTLAPAGEFAPIEVRPQMFAHVGPAPANVLPPPAQDLPVVGIIDSGIPKNETPLKPWIAGHITYVLPPETDHLHGTFVAGLIAGSRTLNGGDGRFPEARARVLDVAALATQSTSIDELLLCIANTVESHPEVKIWNCSFGSKKPGDPDEFGRLAQDLDALSDRHGVLFVVAAGNYETLPLRAWPPTTDLRGMDRISQPAESLRALSVGSLAHLPALVQPDEPSPFSRRGPGAAKTPKPDLTHRGGNCSNTGVFAGAGVRSLLPGGRLGESVGTSFSTPLVSALAANVWQALEQRGIAANPEIVKTLLIHAAALGSPWRKAAERDYYGFGIPDSVLEVLFCAPDTFTMLFRVELFDGIIWEKTPFPIPDCLPPDGAKLRAEGIMTLVYSPPLDGSLGAEYVRANVDASFGSYDPGEDGKMHHGGLVPLDAPAKADLYEKAMVEHGYKWSPVKVYHGRFPRGTAGQNFRLKLELLRRAGEAARAEPQYATVILSFRGIEAGQPVYVDGLRALRAANWTTNAISTTAQLRV